MRLLFLGTPQFAVPSLEALIAAGHRVEAVFTQPDRPKGRGRETAASPVKQAALSMGLPVHQPERIRRPDAVELIRGLSPELMVVVGYGQIIPKSILDIPPLGILNVHASLLPKYRGAAPIQWAIANGESRTGVTIMRIDEGLDTGGMLRKAETHIGPDEDALQLGARLAQMGAGLLVDVLEGLRKDGMEPEPQNPAEATLAPILRKEDGLIDWNWPAPVIHQRSRGFVPWPGAYTYFRGQLLHIWKSKPDTDIGWEPAGTARVRNKRLLIACGLGTALEIEEVQLEGRKRITADAFLNGSRLTENEQLGILGESV